MNEILLASLIGLVTTSSAMTGTAIGFTLFTQTRIDILDKPRSSNMHVQFQNPIGLFRTIVGIGYVEFYDAVVSGLWIGIVDTGLIYQVTPSLSVDVNFFGLTRSASDYNVFSGFGFGF